MSNITTRSFHYKASRDIILLLIECFLFAVADFVARTQLIVLVEPVGQFLWNVLIGCIIVLVVHDITTVYCRTFSLLTISQDEIIYSCGWLTKSTTTIPSNQVRTCSKSSGVLQRACGTMDISIKTAGNNTEIYFINIEKGEEAYQLISQLAKRNNL